MRTGSRVAYADSVASMVCDPHILSARGTVIDVCGNQTLIRWDGAWQTEAVPSAHIQLIES